MPKETGKEAEFRRGPFGHGPRAFAKMPGLVEEYLRPGFHPPGGELLNESTHVWTSLTTRRYSERKEGVGCEERAPILVQIGADERVTIRMVVERVTARLQSRLTREQAPSAAAALADAVDKAWRETYAGPLPTEKEVLQQRSKIFGGTKEASGAGQETAAGPSLMRKRRFVLKALTKNAKKRKRTRFGGNDGVSAEERDSAPRRDAEDEIMPQDKGGRAAGEGHTVDSAGAGAPRRIDDERGCCNIACAEGNDKGADDCTGHGSRAGSVEVSSASTACARGDGGASTGERGEGGSADAEKRREPGLDPGRGGVEKQGYERTGFDEKKGPASPGAGAGHDSEGHAKSEVEEKPKPPDVILTANFVGDLKKGASSKRKKWKVVLEGGALEGYGGVLVFDKCVCSFVSE